MIDINKTTAKYLVLDLTTNDIREEEKGPAEDPAILNDDKCRTTDIWLRRIESGTFIMGSPENELGRRDDEHQHEVRITKPFYMGVFQVTQKQYELIMGNNPSKFKGDTRPVENVSYIDIRGWKGDVWPQNNEVDEETFLGKLRSKYGMIFDLPTEAQWEYACRAGTTTALNSGKNLSNKNKCDEMDEVGRYCFNGGQDREENGNFKAHAMVGSYLPNTLGLYDMHGNVWEWCLDWYGQDTNAVDPVGAQEGTERVIRGGSWPNDFPAHRCRSASRMSKTPESNTVFCCGFRIVINTNDCLNTVDGSDDLKNGKKINIKKVDPKTIGQTKAKYLVLDLNTFVLRKEDEGPKEDPNILNDNKCKTMELWLRRIEPGTFMMGSPKDELEHVIFEDQHEVTITKPYYIGVFPITQKQYKLIHRYLPIAGCVNENPSRHIGDTRPVEGVSYSMIRGYENGSEWPDNNNVDVSSFLGILRNRTKMNFDLPTEAQWEFACRAGTVTALNSGEDLFIASTYYCNMDKLGRHTHNFRNRIGECEDGTSPVGSYLPNNWGLYDMHGNVEEWCLDWFGYLGGDPAIDPRGMITLVARNDNFGRVLRGGFYFSPAEYCRSACRNHKAPNDNGKEGNFSSNGFRLVLNLNNE